MKIPRTYRDKKRRLSVLTRKLIILCPGVFFNRQYKEEEIYGVFSAYYFIISGKFSNISQSMENFAAHIPIKNRGPLQKFNR